MEGRELPLFGRLLREYRLEAGLSQQALAGRAGLSIRGISDRERGVRASPHFDTVHLLADALVLDSRARTSLAAARSHVPALRDPSASPGAESVLPMPPSSLIERQQELKEIADLFQEVANIRRETSSSMCITMLKHAGGMWRV